MKKKLSLDKFKNHSIKKSSLIFGGTSDPDIDKKKLAKPGNDNGDDDAVDNGDDDDVEN